MAVGGFSTSNYLRTTTTPITVKPCTIACWYKPQSVASGRLVEVADSATSNNLMRINTSATNQAQANFNNGGSSVSNSTVATMSTGTWYHIAATFVGTAMQVYLNGVADAAPSVIGADASSIDRIGIGIAGTSASPANPANGYIAEVGLWSNGLTAGELARLALGESPLLVSPATLVWYLRLLTSSDIGNVVAGGSDATKTGTLSDQTHPTIIYPPVRYYGHRRRAA